jgi:hypothetical protein
MTVGTPGNDRLSSTSGSDVLYGDSDGTLYGAIPGDGLGHDTLTTKGYEVYGDAYSLDALSNFLGNIVRGSVGGDDTIKIGKQASATDAYGDSFYLYNSTGGNDTIISAAVEGGSQLFGDGYDVDYSSGGTDTITNTEAMPLYSVMATKCMARKAATTSLREANSAMTFMAMPIVEMGQRLAQTR